jgi:YD repeat-containing protein
VDDNASSNLATASDISDDPSAFDTDPDDFNTNYNYRYDEIGNLIQDTKEEIANIEWNVSGKIQSLTRTSASAKTNLRFDYDASGNRIAKHEYANNISNDWIKSTYYVRDAQSNVMAVYEYKNASPNAEYMLAERHIYGASRIGMDVTPVDMIATTALANDTKHVLGLKQYELNNHLGNVQEVISDYKIPVDIGDFDTNNDGRNDACPSVAGAQDGVADYFIADVKSTQDYYPFGMMMEQRSYRLAYLKGPNYSNDPNDVILSGINATQDPNTIASELDGYRYGFNSQEKTNEIAGNGNHNTAQFWEYDTRLARRWNLDPKPNADLSSYAVLGNNPILMVDLLGDKEYKSYDAYKKDVGNKAIAEKDWNGQDGNWLTSDRTSWAKGTDNRFSKANEFNITQKDGSKNYEDLGQRKDFYKWFQSATDKKGFETRWSGGAAQAVDKLEYLVGGWGTVSGIFGYSSKEIESWVKAGNKLILDDVWGNLMQLYGGPILKGKDAFNWDAGQLLKEQQVIDPSYWNLSNESLTTLENSLKKNYVLSKFISGPKFSGILLSVTDRWVYGMTLMNYKVTSADVPIPSVCPQSPQHSKSTPQR